MARTADGGQRWACRMDGAICRAVSQGKVDRGGDFQLTVGQDLSIGYEAHEKNRVRLYLTESFTFRVLEHAAAVHLKPQAKGHR